MAERQRYGELGAPGLKRYAGAIDEDFITDLSRASSRHKIYTEMRFNDSVIGSVLFLVEQMLRRITWLVKPSDEGDDEAEERVKFIESCMADMSHTWNDFISECLTFLSFGWSFFEIVYKKRTGQKPRGSAAPSKHNDGLIGWRKFAPRSQDALDMWDFDDHGGLQGMYQRPAPTYEQFYIPIEKALLFRTRVEKNNPEGRSVLRHAYRSYYFKKHLEVIMGIGVERDLAGMPVIYLPPGFTADDYTDAKEMVERVRVDEYYGLTIPGPKATTLDAAESGGWLFELVSGGGQRSLQLVEMLQYYDRRMAMAVLAQFVMLGADMRSGSYALSKDQSDMFLKALDGWANMIAETVNQHAIPRLMKLNGWNLEQSPYIEPSGLHRVDIGELSNLIMAFGQAGLDLTDIEDHVRSQANLPPRIPGEGVQPTFRSGTVGSRALETQQQTPGEEEVEKADEPWVIMGREPMPEEVTSGWQITQEDIDRAAREFEAVMGEQPD